MYNSSHSTVPVIKVEVCSREEKGGIRPRLHTPGIKGKGMGRAYPLPRWVGRGYPLSNRPEDLKSVVSYCSGVRPRQRPWRENCAFYLSQNPSGERKIPFLFIDNYSDTEENLQF